MNATAARVPLSSLADRYDLIVIGGGISGAGILREAVRSDARVLLVEARDFASGTSSWSSKLVHGGLRYLKEGQWRLTLESVRERQRLMREAPGLIEPLRFLMPIHAAARPGRWTMQLGLAIYDAMAGARRSGWQNADTVRRQLPWLAADDLQGAVHYEDARTDDARLVLRLIMTAVAEGATARNYTRAALLREGERVVGVRLRDADDDSEREVRASVVVNATGVWADNIPGAPDGAPTLRPLRGSHLVFPASRFPLPCAVSWLHVRDRRPIFAYPWQGATVFGTTDLDHTQPLDDPRPTAAELDYLMAGLRAQFPKLVLAASDAVSLYAGVRPVVTSGKATDPSAESRESARWMSPGLIGITGGKLTTFRVTAREVLREAAKQHGALRLSGADAPLFEPFEGATPTPLDARFGAAIAQKIRAQAASQELEAVPDTPYCWAELRWSVAHEQVRHLQDLMMRRTRLGLVAPQGGAQHLDRIGAICRDTLGWDDARWQRERQDYLDYWRRQHAPSTMEAA